MFRNLSIRTKLLIIMILSTCTALIVAGLVMVAYDLVTFKQQRVNDLSTQAEMLGAITSAALNFDDPKAAQEYLSALSARPNVASAVIYDAKGKVFAVYQRHENPAFRPPVAETSGLRIEGDDLLLFRPIQVGQERIGTVHLRSSLELPARLLGFAGIVISVLIFSLIVAIVLSARLQTLISGPLLEVAQVAHGVIDHQDYSLRVIKRSEDEVGVLVDALNQMLAQIQQREAALQDANQALQVVNKELESFAYSVSHDLRAPLRSMDGFSQALLEDYASLLDAPGQDYLRRIRVGAQRMGQLIDDLLNLSRVSRSEMAVIPVNLAALAHTVILDLQPQQAGRTVQWEVSDPLTAHGDTRLLRVVLDNLLGNSLKFTGKCEQARIEFGQQAEGAEQVFFVRDNGAGFDMAYVNRLFGAFQRLHTPQEFPGIGIGLATVQRIIHRHGGRIWAEAQPGKGATFYFTLPTSN